MPKQWDDFMKSLVEENPQALVSFLLAGAVYKGEPNRELRTRTIVADGLYNVKWNGQSIVLHVEFQRSRKSNMPRRVWEYNASTSLTTRKLVYSVVIYPVKEKALPKPVYRARFRNGEMTQWFSFRQIKLWELEPTIFEQPQLAGLLPFLPLTKNGQNFQTVERMIDKMEQAGMHSQLWLAENIAGLVLKSDQDKQRIRERFIMLDEIIKESWVYQETIDDGKVEGQKDALLQFVEVRFRPLLAQAKQVLKQNFSVQQLQIMLHEIYRANTIEEAQTILLANE